jgi:hypothetical protein
MGGAGWKQKVVICCWARVEGTSALLQGQAGRVYQAWWRLWGIWGGVLSTRGMVTLRSRDSDCSSIHTSAMIALHYI